MAMQTWRSLLAAPYPGCHCARHQPSQQRTEILQSSVRTYLRPDMTCTPVCHLPPIYVLSAKLLHRVLLLWPCAHIS